MDSRDEREDGREGRREDQDAVPAGLWAVDDDILVCSFPIPRQHSSVIRREPDSYVPLPVVLLSGSAPDEGDRELFPLLCSIQRSGLKIITFLRLFLERVCY